MRDGSLVDGVEHASRNCRSLVFASGAARAGRHLAHAHSSAIAVACDGDVAMVGFATAARRESALGVVGA